MYGKKILKPSYINLFYSRNYWQLYWQSLLLHCGFFIIVLDLRLTKLIRGCRETAFNFLYQSHSSGFPLYSFYNSRWFWCRFPLLLFSNLVSLVDLDAQISFCMDFCRTRRLSGPMLKSKSTILRFGRKPCFSWNTW